MEYALHVGTAPANVPNQTAEPMVTGCTLTYALHVGTAPALPFSPPFFGRPQSFFK
jgi:hypothetical protein